MSPHYLIIEKDEAYAARFPHSEEERTYRLVCPDGNGCSGWQECWEPHVVDGKSADDGPWDCDDGDPWEGYDTYVFHGIEHTWKYGFGWTVPFEGCVVGANDWEPPDDAHQKPYGTYPVEDVWCDDTEVVLVWLEEQ